MKGRGPAVVLAIIAVVAGAAAASQSGPVVVVPAGSSVQRAVSSAPGGATVILGPGAHEGPIVVARSLVLQGSEGAVLRASPGDDAALTVNADGVVVRDLRVAGGSTGILVEHARGVELEGVSVSHPDLHGILIAGARARVTDADVSGLISPYAQGIEVFDAPGTVVEGSRFSGGREGIATFLSHGVRLNDNVVTDTTMRAIAVNEMSAAHVAGNVVKRAAGAGLYCGDMSMCAFSDNRVDEVDPGSPGRSAAGWGLVVEYHAVASTDDDRLAGALGAATILVGSRLADTSPLEFGARWGVLAPGALALLAVAGLLLVGLGAGRLLTRLLPVHGTPRDDVWDWGVTVALITGLAVQTFHMAEHTLQVFRVHADGVPSRGGIVGPAVEPEWIHFAYNSAVLLMLVLLAVGRARGWTPRGNVVAGDRLLAAGVLIQGYHVIEHTTKLVQHITSGAKVNPGLLGGEVNLVWLHFVINLAVYAAFLGACACYIRLRPGALRRVVLASE